MELPSDIWGLIVKKSKMSITEIVNDMDDKEIRDLQYIIWRQKIVNKEKLRLKNEELRLEKAKLKKIERLEKAKLKIVNKEKLRLEKVELKKAVREKAKLLH
jgi:hypothetical protein